MPQVAFIVRRRAVIYILLSLLYYLLCFHYIEIHDSIISLCTDY